MLYLNREAILAALSLEDTMAAVERALLLYESGEYEMPDRLGVSCGSSNLLLLMPSVGQGGVVSKILTLYPENPSQGRAAISGLVLLTDQATGEFQAILDAGTVTAMRTGAVTGVSVRYLAREDASSVGLIGCGAQGYYQVLYACAARDITRVTLNSRTCASADRMRERLVPALPGVEITVAESAAGLVRASDIVITATTARAPVVPDDDGLFEGRHWVAIGSFQPGVRELPDAVFRRTAHVWVDTLYAMEESGELSDPLARGLLREDQVISLGAHIARGTAPDRGQYGTTFSKSVGMALFDLTTAQACFAAARAKGLGVVLPE